MDCGGKHEQLKTMNPTHEHSTNKAPRTSDHLKWAHKQNTKNLYHGYIDKIRVYVIQIEGGFGNLNVQTQIEGNPTISD